MVRRILFGVAFILVGLAALDRPAAARAAQTVEPGFTSLFNGKDFTGWKISGPASSFTIQDGAMVANGPARHAYYDGAVQESQLPEFRAEGGRHDPGRTRTAASTSSLSTRRSEASSRVRRLSLEGLRNPGEQLAHRPDQDRQPVSREGRHSTVTGQGQRVVHRAHHRQGQYHHDQLNGKQVVQVDAAGRTGTAGAKGRDGRSRGPGTIALQGHDPNSTVYYKNIRIKPLD